MDSSRWMSAVEIAAQVQSGERRTIEIVDEAIGRIEAEDPALACVVIPLFDRARERAGDIDTSSPLAGVPMLLKDAGEELAGTPMWVGTQALRRADHQSTTTTTLAGRFEELGAAIVGKSACPELSASSTTEPPGFEPTRNPWDLTRSAGGSSGGSAAAVAAGLVPIAHGSDGSGSLRFPAALCGVPTLKPSRGRIPSSPAAGSPDPLGLWTQFAVARDVGDLIALFACLATDDVRAPANDMSPLRVGIVTSDPIIGLTLHDECIGAVAAVAALLGDAGHVVDESYPSAFSTLFEPFLRTMSTIGPWLRAGQVEWVADRLGRPCGPGDLSDDVLALAEHGRSITDAAVAAAIQEVSETMMPVANWWDQGHDILVSPVTLEPAWALGEDAPIRTGMYAAPFSFTGQPAVVIPGSWTQDGRPVGVQLVGRAGSDETLLDIALDLQQRLGWLQRRPSPPRQQ